MCCGQFLFKNIALSLLIGFKCEESHMTGVAIYGKIKLHPSHLLQSGIDHQFPFLADTASFEFAVLLNIGTQES